MKQCGGASGTISITHRMCGGMEAPLPAVPSTDENKTTSFHLVRNGHHARPRRASATAPMMSDEALPTARASLCRRHRIYLPQHVCPISRRAWLVVPIVWTVQRGSRVWLILVLQRTDGRQGTRSGSRTACADKWPLKMCPACSFAHVGVRVHKGASVPPAFSPPPPHLPELSLQSLLSIVWFLHMTRTIC